ncbi:MAG TPA: hypothetical protein VMH83_08050 [Candidatus Acidoferrum sp.]|nr:hypothetical protein [Candidatus Acidoferrum sp.]
MKIKFAVITLAVTLPFAAHAYEADDAAKSASSQAKPEQIIIIGERDLLKQVVAAERNAYDIFNKFNDDKRFAINCSNFRPVGTHFEREVCAPQFKLDALSGHAQDYLESLHYFVDLGASSDTNATASHLPAEVAIAQQTAAYKAKMKKIAEEHPEFLQALVKYSRLRQQFDSRKPVEKPVEQPAK